MQARPYKNALQLYGSRALYSKTHLSMIHINLNKPAAAEGGVTVMICQPGEHSGWY